MITRPTESLSGARVLVVEDDYFAATELAGRLREADAEVIGPAASVEDALRYLRSHENISCAVLDIKLGTETVFPVADELQRQAMPFLFASAYDANFVPPRHADRILLQKPFEPKAVVSSVSAAMRGRVTIQRDMVQNAVLTALPAWERQALLPWLEQANIKKGAILETPHRPITKVYFPLTSILSVIVGVGDTSIEVGLIGREGFTGYGMVAADDFSPYALTGRSDGIALSMSSRRFSNALIELPSLRHLAARYARVLSVQESYGALAIGKCTIAERLARYILMLHDRIDGDTVSLTHDDLADALGVRRPGVTDALHVLEGEGLIRSSRGRLTVRNRPGLIAIAGETYGVPEKEFARLMLQSGRAMH